MAAAAETSPLLHADHEIIDKDNDVDACAATRNKNDAELQLKKPPWRGVCTVIGCILVHLTLGSLYSWGNLTTYVTSYIRKDSFPHDLTYHKSFWVLPAIGGCQSVSIYLGGLLGRRLGNIWTIFLGCFIMSLGVSISFWTVQTSFFTFIITFGVLQGLGVGLAYAQALTLSCRWFPAHGGLINGLIVAGFGCGGAIFNELITNYINPDNEQATSIVDGKNYFDKKSVLDRVPSFFYVLGATFCGIQVFGLALMFEPDSEGKGRTWLARIITCLKKDEVENLSADATHGRDETAETASSSHRSSLHQPSSLQSSLHRSSSYPSSEEEDEITSENLPAEGSACVKSNNYTQKETLKSWPFWILVVTFLCNTTGVLFFIGLWKVYGQSSSYDDHFLATVAALTSVANGAGRVLWGAIADRIGYKVPMACVNCFVMALLLALNSSVAVGPGLYAVFVVAIFLSFSGTFSLVPTACVKTFGVESMSENLGMIFVFSLPGGLIGTLVETQTNLDMLQWYVQFWIVASCFLPGFVATLFYPTHIKEGLKI